MASQPLEHEIIETSYRGRNSCLSVGQKKFTSLEKLSGFTFQFWSIHAKGTKKHGACLVVGR